MNSKAFIGIVSIVVLLLVVWGGLAWFGNDERITDLSSLDIGPVTEEYVDTIVIEEGDDRLELTLRDGSWKVEEYPVAPTQLALIWEAFADVSVSGPVSRNQANFGRFGVGDSDMSVVFRKGDYEQRLRIGLQATTFDTTYVRNAEHDEVYVAAANLRSLFSTNVSDWRDKTIVQIDSDDVSAIEVEQEAEVVRIERDEIGAWHVMVDEERALADETALAALLANLNPLTARAFVDESGASEYARRRVDASVRIYGAEDVLRQQLDLVEEGDYWWARVSGNDTVYDVQRYKLADVLVTTDRLLGITEEETEETVEE